MYPATGRHAGLREPSAGYLSIYLSNYQLIVICLATCRALRLTHPVLHSPGLQRALLLVVVLHRRCLRSTLRVASTSASPQPWTWCTPAAAAARCCRWPPTALWRRGRGSQRSRVERQSLRGVCQVSHVVAGASALVSHAFECTLHFCRVLPVSPALFGMPLGGFVLHDRCQHLPSCSQTEPSVWFVVRSTRCSGLASLPTESGGTFVNRSRTSKDVPKKAHVPPPLAGMSEPTPALSVEFRVASLGLPVQQEQPPSISSRIEGVILAYTHTLQVWRSLRLRYRWGQPPPERRRPPQQTPPSSPCAVGPLGTLTGTRAGPGMEALSAGTSQLLGPSRRQNLLQ